MPGSDRCLITSSLYRRSWPRMSSGVAAAMQGGRPSKMLIVVGLAWPIADERFACKTLRQNYTPYPSRLTTPTPTSPRERRERERRERSIRPGEGEMGPGIDRTVAWPFGAASTRLSKILCGSGVRALLAAGARIAGGPPGPGVGTQRRREDLGNVGMMVGQGVDPNFGNIETIARACGWKDEWWLKKIEKKQKAVAKSSIDLA